MRDKQQCMWVFCNPVPFCVGLSVRLCYRVLTWAFRKAVPAGAARSSAFCEAQRQGVPHEGPKMVDFAMTAPLPKAKS